MFFTNGNLSRIRKTLAQFTDKPIRVILLDDTAANDVSEFVKQEYTNTNISYHGSREQSEILQIFEGLTDQTTDFFSAFGRSYWTLGHCRNYAVALAKLLGFERILMVDDDMLVQSYEQVLQVFKLLSRFNIVGAKTFGMADDSVVGHIIRLLGLEQDDFISGQFVGIEVNSVSYYFPNVYNEDWLFFFLEHTKSSLAQYTEVEQLKYDPFERAGRKSLFQEFGEIAVDGVFEAVVYRKNAALLQRRWFWTDICSERKKLLAEIQRMTESLPNGKRFKEIFDALRTYHLSLNPIQFSFFFAEYCRSLDGWHSLLDKLSKYHQCHQGVSLPKSNAFRAD